MSSIGRSCGLILDGFVQRRQPCISYLMDSSSIADVQEISKDPKDGKDVIHLKVTASQPENISLRRKLTNSRLC